MSREVQPLHNNPHRFRYQVRVGQCHRRFSRRHWFAQLERYFMAWEPHESATWFRTEEEAVAFGNRLLDALDNEPNGRLV